MPTILDLDLGKFKGVACCYDLGTAEARFTTIHRDSIPNYGDRFRTRVLDEYLRATFHTRRAVGRS